MSGGQQCLERLLFLYLCFSLSLSVFNVIMTKIEGKSQPNLILIDAEKFQDVKWIRIKCDDSDEEMDRKST